MKRLIMAVAIGICGATMLPMQGVSGDKPSISVLKVKSGNYKPGGKVTRREFVEKALGIKFGWELTKYDRLNGGFDPDVGLMRGKLSAPVCGRKDVTISFIDDKLAWLMLHSHNTTKLEASVKATEARLDKFCLSVGKWLGIKKFGPPEEFKSVNHEGKKEYKIERVFEDDDLSVKVAVRCVEQGKKVVGEECSLTIMPKLAEAKEEVKEDEETEEDKAIKARMKKLMLPNFRLMPPSTIADGVQMLAVMSKDFDDSSRPLDKRGFNFKLIPPLKYDLNGPCFPKVQVVCQSEISLWNALKQVCECSYYKFIVRDTIIVVMPIDYSCAPGR